MISWLLPLHFDLQHLEIAHSHLSLALWGISMPTIFSSLSLSLSLSDAMV